MIRTAVFTLLMGFSAMAEDVYATFDVVARKEANLNLSTPGIVTKLHADVGSRVRAGEVLLEIDNDDLKAGVDLAKESLKKAKIEEQFARQTFERYQKVQSVIEADLMDQHTLAHQKAAAAASEAKASLRYKETLLEKTRLRAPFGGVIAERNVEAGDSAGGGAPLFRLITSPEVKLVLKFDEKYLPLVKKGAKVRFRVDGESRERVGTVSKIHPSVNPKNRKATAEVLSSHIAPGLFGEAYIVVK